jgi:hypothetical protein
MFPRVLHALADCTDQFPPNISKLSDNSFPDSHPLMAVEDHFAAVLEQLNSRTEGTEEDAESRWQVSGTICDLTQALDHRNDRLRGPALHDRRIARWIE